MDIYEWLMFGVALASFVLSVIKTVINTTKKEKLTLIDGDKHDEEEEITE